MPGYFFFDLETKMQKEDLDAPGNAQTIVTMDYMASFFPPHEDSIKSPPQQHGQSFTKEYSLTLLAKAEL